MLQALGPEIDPGEFVAVVGLSLIMVTHDPKAAEFASRHLQVDKGQLADGARAAA